MNQERIRGTLIPILSSLMAVLAAFVTGGILLAILGKDPIAAYSLLFSRGLGSSFGVVETIIKMGPLLFVSAGLLIALRASVWNIGIDGQFLMGAAAAGIVAPALVGKVPLPIFLILSSGAAFIGGALWGVIPAILKVRYDLNEIITTIMMNYLAIFLTSWMVKGPFKDPDVVAPQMRPIPPEWRLPDIPGTRIHFGIVFGLAAVIVVYFMFRSGTVGFSLDVIGASPKAAEHAGIPVKRWMVVSLLFSAGLAGLAGANDVLGVKSLFQGEWNPAYGLTGFALVFLARLNGIAIIPFAYFFAFLLFGGELMARTSGIPAFYVQVLEGLMLIFFAISVYFERRFLEKELESV